jgi:hypothetical protein
VWAKESRTASSAKVRPRREVDGVIVIQFSVGGAGPAGLASVDPRGEVAVLVGPDVVLLSAGETLEVELELGSGAYT